MRVLFVTSHLRVGGAQRQWSILVPELARAGCEVSVLALEAEGDFYDELASQGIPVCCTRMRRRSDVGGGVRVVLAARRVAPEVVVTQGVGAQVLGQLIAWRERAAHVATDHRGPGLPFAPHREVLLRAIAPHVDRVVAVTERQIPQLVRRRYRRDVIRVVPNGVSPTLVASGRAREEVRDELGLSGDAFVALLVAVLRPEKRPAVFVEAVARAAASNSRVCGLVVGSGPEAARVERLAAETRGVVRLLGQRADVGDLLEAADVVCLTSAAEAAPMSALEAMAAGRPVVSTDVGGMAELVLDGETGFLTPAGDVETFACRLAELAADPALGERLGAAGRRRQAERFTLDRMVDGYARVLREAVAA